MGLISQSFIFGILSENWNKLVRNLLSNTKKMNALSLMEVRAKKILLIHQEQNMQEVVKACLTDLAGWDVQVANSIFAGLQEAKIEQPDAIILDDSIRKIDGLIFLKQLRIQPLTKLIPVVLLIFRGKWVELQPNYLQKYQVITVVVNPLAPASLAAQIAIGLGWNLEPLDLGNFGIVAGTR